MNPLHPKKLLLSKWTAVAPVAKNKHFLVSKVIACAPPSQEIEAVELEAVFSEKDAVVFAMADARMTHPNVSCTQANAAYVLAIRHLVLNPGDRKGAISAAQKFLAEVSSEVTEWLDEAISGDLPDALPQAGFVRIAFTYAFFHLNQGSSYRAAISDTLIRGGDTDTNACIVGGLVGAYRGLNNLLVSEASRKMIYPVMMCDPSLGQIRPDVYHASSVPLLLRRLVESIGLPEA
jgi:ADP-ribosyl-[dinitrogen reductase] hydrolase